MLPSGLILSVWMHVCAVVSVFRLRACLQMQELIAPSRILWQLSVTSNPESSEGTQLCRVNPAWHMRLTAAAAVIGNHALNVRPRMLL